MWDMMTTGVKKAPSKTAAEGVSAGGKAAVETVGLEPGLSVSKGKSLKVACSGGLERSVAEEVVEETIVEDAVASANGCLAAAGDVVGEADARLDHAPVIGVELASGSRTDWSKTNPFAGVAVDASP